MSEEIRAMPEEQFWAIVEEAQWDHHRDPDLCKRLIRKHIKTAEDANAMRKTFGVVRNKVASAVERYENEQSVSIGLGDDGFDDLCSHIVGCGRAAVQAVLNMPKLAFDRAAARDFMESFSYAVPYEDDFDPKERAREERARMRAAQQRTARDQLRTAIEPALAAIKEAIPGIRSATIARALREATNDVIRDQPDDDEAGGFMVNNEHEDDQLALHGFGHHIEIWREDGNVHIAVNDEDEGNTTHFTLGTPDETQKC